MAHMEVDGVSVRVRQLAHVTEFHAFDVNVLKPVFDLASKGIQGLVTRVISA